MRVSFYSVSIPLISNVFELTVNPGSHKRRDNRCHIAAPKLETSFCQALEAEGWTVDRDLTDEDCMGPSLEESSADKHGEEGPLDTDNREKLMQERLREASEGATTGQKVALIIKVSHIGGHKYAGKCARYYIDLLVLYALYYRQCHHLYSARSIGRHWNMVWSSITSRGALCC